MKRDRSESAHTREPSSRKNKDRAQVVKTGSINKAAENLYVTQPGLSDSIKKMESELGLTLLNRSKTGVTLTENGRIVARHAVNILTAYNRMLNELKLLSDDDLDNPKETLTIATSPLFAAALPTFAMLSSKPSALAFAR